MGKEKNEPYSRSKNERDHAEKRPAANLRGRTAQKKDVAVEDWEEKASPPRQSEAMKDPARTGRPHRGPEREDALHDSAEPPPPQLRRARATRDPSKAAKDKDTGIKHRNASGAKERRGASSNPGKTSSADR